MSTPQAQVAEFHQATDTPIVARPAVPPEDRRALRIKLLTEECDEAIEAMSEARAGSPADVAHVAKELADVLVVTYGAALEWGIDLVAVMDAVHESNMAKVGPGGKVQRRADGKVLKPDGWQPPDIEAVLTEQRELR
jgi:predicted HAD superfamily Cof-like phosphohydrolase